MILTAIHGFCMALADSVPGVSGGTIAFILGFYDRFLNALHSLFGKDADVRKSAIIYLLKLGLGWIFGMGACVLTLASFPFVLRAEKKSLRGQERYAPFALLGLLLVVLLTLLRANTVGVAIRFAGAPVWMLGYIFLSGAVAITAMVLPGISGSTILLIAGVYLPAIQAIRAFLGFDFSVFPGLCALGLGVIAGVGLSIHAIRAALRKYRSQMVWLILGLMAGSLYAIVMGPAGLDAPRPTHRASSRGGNGLKVCSCYFSSLSVFRFHSACQTATALQFYLPAASHSGANEAASRTNSFTRAAPLSFSSKKTSFSAFSFNATACTDSSFPSSLYCTQTASACVPFVHAMTAEMPPSTSSRRISASGAGAVHSGVVMLTCAENPLSAYSVNEAI